MENEKIRIIHKYVDYVPDPGQTTVGPSLTVPDQTMSLRTLLDRHTRGQPIMGDLLATYDPDGTALDYDHMDLAEQELYRDALQAEHDEIKENYSASLQKAEKNRKQQQKLLNKATTQTDDKRGTTAEEDGKELKK